MQKPLEPSFDLKDSELIQLAHQFYAEAQPFHSELLLRQKVNEDYYLGKQTNWDRIPRNKCNATQNQIFMGVETIIPIMTSNPAQFVTTPAQENEESEALSNSLQQVLKVQYETKRIKEVLQLAARHMIIYRLGIIKVFWDEYIDDWSLKVVRPQRIWIPRYGMDEDEIPFIIEKHDFTIQEIEDTWGKEKADKIRQTGSGIEQQEEDPRKQQKVSNIYTVWEVWTNDFVFWKHGGDILEKKKNPNFDFTGRTEETTDEFGNAVVEDTFYNHFRRPKKPYVFLSPFKLGRSVVGETDLIEQGIPLQDVANVLLRQVVDNAKKMGNSAWFVDSEAMSEEEARAKITNAEGLIIWGSGAANQNIIRRESPPPLPAYIQNTKMDTESSFDNIFGTHSTTRGERRQPETLGGRQMLKQSDISRIDLLVREIERAVELIGNWGVQMMKMFYESEKTVKIYGENGLEFIEFSRNNIEDGVEVTVKAGSTLQTDELARRNEALQLFQAGALDPVTLYERLKFPNPQEAAERLLNWMKGQLTPEQGGETPPEGVAKGGQGGQGNQTPPSAQSLQESFKKGKI